MRTRSARSNTIRVVHTCAAGAVCAAVLTLVGCYEHTIRDEGWGRSKTPIYEPNVAEPGDEDRLPKTRGTTRGGMLPK